MTRINIKDSGKGIAKKDLDKVFEPFERIGAETTEIEGSGLGLSIVKKLVSAMGGEVGGESILEEGSTFWVELPTTENPSKYIKPNNLPEKTAVSSGKKEISYTLKIMLPILI